MARRTILFSVSFLNLIPTGFLSIHRVLHFIPPHIHSTLPFVFHYRLRFISSVAATVSTHLTEKVEIKGK